MHFADFRQVSFRRILILLLAVAILGSAIYSVEAVSTSYLGLNSSLAYSSSSIAMLGVDQVVSGGAVTQAFVDSVAAQGLKWNRECTCFLTSTMMGYLLNAGISTIGMIPNNPETSCGSGVLQAEATYKSAIQSVVNQFPAIHNWEYGNEPQNYWCNISPQNYFIGLVWAYQVIISTSGHSSDTIQGPTETIWTGSGTGSCYDSSKLSWFQTFWSQTYTEPTSGKTYTPNSVLTWVSLHVYTQGELWSSTITSGSCAGQTVSQMLTNGLNAYYSAEGDSKQMIISETGFPSSDSGGTSEQATWYQEMMPFYNSLGYIHGVFAYDLYDTQSVLWGLFDSSLNAKPSWSVFQSYLSSTSLTSTTSSTSTSSFSVTLTSTTSSISTTETISTITTSSSSTTGEGSSQVTSSKSTLASSSSIGISSSSSQAAASLPNSGAVSQAGAITAMLSALSPERDPSAAYGIATYEICLIGALGYMAMSIRRRRFGRSNSGIGDWRW
jgi:hypothetical protein